MTAVPKNIVVFADGTGQEGGEGQPTNVYQMFRMIENRTSRQVAFYDAGVGTGWRKFTGNVGGMGISRNILQGYRFIFEQYESGDRIYLLGFSRGAATVRSLSSFIHHFGILPKSRPELIKRAWKIYKKKDAEERAAKARDLVKRHHTMWATIRFLGCYDTVAALGLPFKTASVLLDGIPGFRHKFHNFTLSKSVEHAYHALAIDDERKTFHPVLWDPEVDESYQTVRQVWFAGAHSDVGGGYSERGLSDIALVWLTRQAVLHGLRIYPNNEVTINEDHEGLMHDSRGRAVTRVYRRKARSWSADRSDMPIVHQSVLQRAASQNLPDEESYRPWILDVDHDVEPWQRFTDMHWRPQPNEGENEDG
jgi:uncharacterized protein (DUF2235 family)